MRIIQSLLILVLAYFLLTVLWPLFLVLLVVIAYQFFKARRILRQGFQAEDPNQQDRTYETFKQDNNGEVIDANYTERSPSDGSK